MTNYFVKNGGSGLAATTDPGTGGDWSGAFDSIDVALDTALSSDRVFASHLHLNNLAGSPIYASAGTSADPVMIYSVDDLDTSVYRPGATEGKNSSGTIDFTGTGVCSGVNFNFFGDMYVSSSGSSWELSDSAIVQYSTSQKGIGVEKAASFLTLKNCSVKFNHVGSGFEVVLARSKITLVGVTVDPTGVAPNNLLQQGVSGSHYEAIGCDFSAIAAGGQVIDTLSATSTLANFVIKGCKIGNAIITDGISGPCQRVDAYSVGTVSETGYFYVEDSAGIASEETAIYRTLSSGGFSAEIIHKAATAPFEFDLANFIVDVTKFTSNVTFTMHYAVDGKTTDLAQPDLIFIVHFPDGASNVMQNSVSNFVSPVTAGSPTIETGLWTGLSGINKQMSASITIPIGILADQIASGACKVTAKLSKPSQIVFICPEVELS